MKSLFIMVTLTLVLSMATTVFAAEQGFDKVGAQHWAIQKYETASDENKAIIDKLSIEFASELNTLGARADKSEKKRDKAKAAARDNLTFSGSTKTEWITERDDNKGTRATKFKSEVKLNALIEADERTKIMAGIN
ncbi:MAG: hypothetical protein H6Q73_4272 [Firmicutes bacterium]|nr:hypothetical protein [Bacillota bacterium]